MNNLKLDLGFNFSPSKQLKDGTWVMKKPEEMFKFSVPPSSIQNAIGLPNPSVPLSNSQLIKNMAAAGEVDIDLNIPNQEIPKTPFWKKTESWVLIGGILLALALVYKKKYS